MTSFKARSRLVNFRLTQEELENLRVACLLRGSRNLSEFARTAVLTSVETQIDPDSAVRDRLDRLEARLAGLESLLQSLLNHAVIGAAQNPPSTMPTEVRTPHA